MFYAIAGVNGFGVYQDCERLLKAKGFVIRPIIEKYDSRFEAFSTAVEIYNSLQEDFDAAFFGGISDIRIDWIVFRKDVIKKNREELGI